MPGRSTASSSSESWQDELAVAFDLGQSYGASAAQRRRPHPRAAGQPRHMLGKGGAHHTGRWRRRRRRRRRRRLRGRSRGRVLDAHGQGPVVLRRGAGGGVAGLRGGAGADGFRGRHLELSRETDLTMDEEAAAACTRSLAL
ncbi:hypothetical protein L209DRAFT_85734 [Thermothelomyces heterothallicus CBS 203.75]